MPLNPDAKKVIRKNLKKVRNGKKPTATIIGTLTDKQLADLNAGREKRGLEPMRGEFMFHGRHIYDRRIVDDGYSTIDVIAQISAAMSEDSVIRITPKMTVLQSTVDRQDGYGNYVRDEVVLECSGRFPYPELYSVIPKGDEIKPGAEVAVVMTVKIKIEEGRNEATPALET